MQQRAPGLLPAMHQTRAKHTYKVGSGHSAWSAWTFARTVCSQALHGSQHDKNDHFPAQDRQDSYAIIRHTN